MGTKNNFNAHQTRSTFQCLVSVLTLQPQTLDEINAMMKLRGYDKTRQAVWADLKIMEKEGSVEVGQTKIVSGRKAVNVYRLADNYKPALATVFQFPRCASAMDWCAKHLAVA